MFKRISIKKCLAIPASIIALFVAFYGFHPGNPDPMEQVVPVGPKPADLLMTLEYDPDKNVTATKVSRCGGWHCGRSFFGFRRCCRTCTRDVVIPPWQPGGPAGWRETYEQCRVFWFY